ncbi:MAG: dTDP-4-dehydrorhamnose reductase [Nitrosomonas sp.]|nr:dTDP-4-dehydrorhamnose reductase [Nitrosomonas sp.]
MKILLLGKNGQIGWELNRSLLPLGEVIALDRLGADLSKPERLRHIICDVKPDVIVNASAYTAVDKAEEGEELATIINGNAVGVIAEEALKLKALFVHYSTDYVFDGTIPETYTEEDTPNPINAYGRSKLLGERKIIASGCNHLILRTAWVYSTRGENFAKTMLRLARERDKLNVINDQAGAPTGADLVADITAHTIRILQHRPELSGLYHLVAGGETSWYGYANFVIDFARRMGVELKVAPNAVQPVPTSAFPTLAKRPHNSRMDTTKLQQAFDLTLPLWQTGVTRMLTETLDR